METTWVNFPALDSSQPTRVYPSLPPSGLATNCRTDGSWANEGVWELEKMRIVNVPSRKAVRLMKFSIKAVACSISFHLQITWWATRDTINWREIARHLSPSRQAVSFFLLSLSLLAD